MVRAGETIGLVEQLSWRAIKVRTMEGNALLIPNIVASRDRLEVFRRGSVPMARILRVGLEYDLPPAPRPRRARSRGRGRSGASRRFRRRARLPRPLRTTSSIDYELRYWLEDYARYLDVDSRVRERVWYRLEREGIADRVPRDPPAPVRRMGRSCRGAIRST